MKDKTKGSLIILSVLTLMFAGMVYQTSLEESILIALAETAKIFFISAILSGLLIIGAYLTSKNQ